MPATHVYRNKACPRRHGLFSGRRAVDVAAEWARDADAQLRIVHVTPPKGWLSGAWGLKPAVVDTIQERAANALKQAAEHADPERGIELSTGVLTGPAARTIVRAAGDYRANLLVVGARGERDADREPGLGGTSAKLLESAKTPLLLVRGTRRDPVAGVVAALDLSPRSHGVLEWADRAAGDRHLYVYHAYEVPFAARLETYGLSPSAIDVYSGQAQAQSDADVAAVVTSIGRAAITSRVVERGEPPGLLRRYIESIGPSLVVLGKHVRRRRPSSASKVGNVCRFIASSVPADVLIV
jgi:nucleotide-binding universal stress UspA family protein